MKKVCGLFPKMKVITAKVDQGLNDVRSLPPFVVLARAC